MSKIRGKFAPLFEELGNDPRWIVECTDFEKMVYMMILYTIYMNNNLAPLDPRYYQVRYGVRARTGQLQHAFDTLTKRFPKLKCTGSGNNKKLSLLNYVAYKNGVAPKPPLDVEVDKEVNVDKDKEVNKDLKDPASPDSLPQEPKSEQPKAEDPRRVDLSNIPVLDLNEAAKHRIYNKMLFIFNQRGWCRDSDFVKEIFSVCAGRVNGETVTQTFTYFQSVCSKYINENADLICEASKGREQTARRRRNGY